MQWDAIATLCRDPEMLPIHGVVSNLELNLMPTPSEHKTVQARILEYAQDIGWTFVPRHEAEQRRGFDPDTSSTDRNRDASLYFDDLLYAKVREFNPLYTEQQGALLNQFHHLHI